MYKLVRKLKRLKSYFRLLDKDRFSNIKNDPRMALTRLTEIQVEIQSDPLNADLRLKEEQAMHEYNMLNKARMTFFQRR